MLGKAGLAAGGRRLALRGRRRKPDPEQGKRPGCEGGAEAALAVVGETCALLRPDELWIGDHGERSRRAGEN